MMRVIRKHKIFKNLTSMVMVALLLSALPITVLAYNDADSHTDASFLENTVSLTSEEQEYLKEHPTVAMAADASWRPLEYVDNEQYAGVISEITRRITEYTGLKIEYDVKESYAEALEAVQTGQADMISGLADDEDMAKEFNVILTDPYLTISSAVVSNKELSNLYEESEHKKIAVVSDDYANWEIEQRISNSELIECSTNEECLEKIQNKEVDMAIIASYCAEYYLGIPKYSDFHNHLMSDFSWQLSFGVNKDTDPLLVSILNKGISSMSQVDINSAVYKGIMDAEYDNDFLKMVYNHPLWIISVVLSVVFLVGVFLFVIFQSKKKEQMRTLQDATTLQLALERTHLCIWKYDIATKKIIRIHNEHEKHGFSTLRENIPESVIEAGYIHPEDEKNVREVLARVQKGEQDVQGCWRIREQQTLDTQNADYWWEQVLFHIVYDEHHRPVTAIGVSEDISVEKKAQRDALTSVYSRSSFEETAKVVLSERRNSYLQCAFLILDLDGFKQINDTYGHGTGDRVLISVGTTLNRVFRSTDIVGRLGGDEFTVFMTSISKSEDAQRKAAELVEEVNKISVNEGYPFAISCSIGIAVEIGGSKDLSVMYKKADLALYDAKHAGKNRYCIYDAGAKKKILVVDDIEMNREILKKTLGAEYDVYEAENGIDALRVMNEVKGIRVVVTDIVMPEMDGIELIKQIHANEELKDVAIIAETQVGDAKQEKEILDLGVDDFIYKAASPGVIQMRVRNVMRIKEL